MTWIATIIFEAHGHNEVDENFSAPVEIWIPGLKSSSEHAYIAKMELLE